MATSSWGESKPSTPSNHSTFPMRALSYQSSPSVRPGSPSKNPFLLEGEKDEQVRGSAHCAGGTPADHSIISERSNAASKSPTRDTGNQLDKLNQDPVGAQASQRGRNTSVLGIRRSGRERKQNKNIPGSENLSFFKLNFGQEDVNSKGSSRRGGRARSTPSNMNILYWNARDIVRANFLSNMRLLLRQHDPQMVVISETKVSRANTPEIVERLLFDNHVLVDPVGLSGGILVMWDSAFIHFEPTKVNRDLLVGNHGVKVKHVKRECNQLADALACNLDVVNLLPYPDASIMSLYLAETVVDSPL